MLDVMVKTVVEQVMTCINVSYCTVATVINQSLVMDQLVTYVHSNSVRPTVTSCTLEAPSLCV